MTKATIRATRDFVRDRKASFLLWGLPALVMIGVGPLGLNSPAHGLIWASCLTVFGFGCLANARRAAAFTASSRVPFSC